MSALTQIGTGGIKDDAITTAKIANNAVVTGKVQEARPEEEEVEYDSDGNVIEKPPDPYADLMMDYPDDYNEVNAIKFLENVGVHYVSCSPFRVPIAYLSLSQLVK